ncbi:2-oxoglutarate and iron-dependent oxygenase domain-containing protein [Moorena sp. SIO3I8]|uniref:2-oxoglutarate and iron-dependent oxygenase domain-containing protein n=1 Tax=Moorena sp. SIO3I8 TaxID=2607833 RepID=UPI0025DF9D11|nr:2-oxoglutarate and iron-dependent oxygenase domain-containing protein [Moorena sp. SIO3I8]
MKYHGIFADLVKQTIDRNRNFFQLPKDIKEDYGQDKQTVYPNTSRGYVPLYGETLHEDVGPDPKELFDQGNRTSTFRQAVYWPQLDS